MGKVSTGHTLRRSPIRIACCTCSISRSLLILCAIPLVLCWNAPSNSPYSRILKSYPLTSAGDPRTPLRTNFPRQFGRHTLLPMSKRLASNSLKPRKRAKNGISSSNDVLDLTLDLTPSPGGVMHIWHMNAEEPTVVRRSSAQILSPQSKHPLPEGPAVQFGEVLDATDTPPAGKPPTNAHPKRKRGNDSVSFKVFL
jgi:hypothetical protein